MELFSVIREPRVPSDHPPVLVLLHGIGADELDLMPLADGLQSSHAPKFRWGRAIEVRGVGRVGGGQAA